MVRNHQKPSKAMVKKSKTIEKPLIAMVRPPKNIQWWWSPQKPLKIYNGLFKTIEIYNGFLKTIKLVNGALKSTGTRKWFSHCTWLSHEKKESSRVSSLTVAWKKTLTISSLWKIDHRCALDSVFFGSFLQLFLLHQIFSQLDFMSLNWFCTQQLLHRFHKICKFSHYCRSCIVCTFLTKQTPSIFWYFYKVFNPT